MPYEPPYNPTTQIQDLCMEIAELVGAFTPASAHRSSPTLHRKLRIRTIRSSLIIEGNTLSEDVVSAIIDGKPVLGPAKEIREVQNAQRAYELMDNIDPYSLDDLLRAHKEMMNGLVEGAGVFRTKNAGVYSGDVLIHAGSPARYVPGLMAQLFGWMRETTLHPLVVSSIFHYEFEFIHPFEDGNGRTGRLWHTLLLSRWRPALAWLPIESVILDRQQDYYTAFLQSEQAGECSAFVQLMLEVIRDALRRYTPQVSAADERAERTLAFFRNNPTATIDDLVDYLGCSKRSAERSVAELKAQGLLAREGSARRGEWRVHDKGTDHLS